jgi:hypothetical protein
MSSQEERAFSFMAGLLLLISVGCAALMVL